MGLLLVRRYVSIGERVAQPYTPVRTDYADSTDEQPISGSLAKRHNSYARLRVRTSGVSMRIGHQALWAGTALSVFVNGAFSQFVLITADGAPHSSNVTLPVGTDKYVEIWEGSQSGQTEPNITGAVITSVEILDNDLYVVPPAAPDRRVVFYGDSISQGYGTNNPQESYVALLRAANVVGGVTSYGSVGRALYDDRNSQGIATLASKLSDALADVRPHGRQDLLVVIGTNDWARNAGGAAYFGASVGMLADTVHGLSPNARVQLVSPIIRSGENTPNGGGDTLQNYRDAMSAAASTRSPWCKYWDASAVLTLSDLGDGLHPNAGGHVKMKAYFQGTVLA